MFIGGFLLLGAAQLVVSYFQFSAYSQAMATRDDLIAQLKSVGASTKVLQASAQAPENSLLQGCLTGTGLGCTASGGPLTLYYGPVAPGNAISGPVSGTPVYYNIDGSRCVPAVGEPCVLEVTTSFISQCPASPPDNLIPQPNCMGPPDIVEIIYNIQQVPGTTLGLSQLRLAPYTGTILVRGS